MAVVARVNLSHVSSTPGHVVQIVGPAASIAVDEVLFLLVSPVAKLVATFSVVLVVPVVVLVVGARSDEKTTLLWRYRPLVALVVFDLSACGGGVRDGGRVRGVRSLRYSCVCSYRER